VKRLGIDLRPGEYALARLAASAAVPQGLLDAAVSGGGGDFVSVTRTPTELSVICPAGLAPSAAEVEAGWRLLTVRGPLAFTLTGIIAAIAGELAAAGVALFTLSTFDTDHVLVRGTDVERAVEALRAAGHEVYTGA
jgi:hypothetical protein